MGQYRPLPVLSAFQTLTSDGPQWLSMPPIRSATTGMRSPAESGDRHKGDRTVQRVFPRLAGPLRGAGKYSKKRIQILDWTATPEASGTLSPRATPGRFGKPRASRQKFSESIRHPNPPEDFGGWEVVCRLSQMVWRSAVGVELVRLGTGRGHPVAPSPVIPSSRGPLSLVGTPPANRVRTPSVSLKGGCRWERWK